ncbi:hypothetical protein MTBSS4_710002 [Magnetospirillum sp. SS-4]|nr:hypothetical protein MTBSS4_710002 [Magnetospirillum sp. SS-4]
MGARCQRGRALPQRYQSAFPSDHLPLPMGVLVVGPFGQKHLPLLGRFPLRFTYVEQDRINDRPNVRSKPIRVQHGLVECRRLGQQLLDGILDCGGKSKHRHPQHKFLEIGHIILMKNTVTGGHSRTNGDQAHDELVEFVLFPITLGSQNQALLEHLNFRCGFSQITFLTLSIALSNSLLLGCAGYGGPSGGPNTTNGYGGSRRTRERGDQGRPTQNGASTSKRGRSNRPNADNGATNERPWAGMLEGLANHADSVRSLISNSPRNIRDLSDRLGSGGFDSVLTDHQRGETAEDQGPDDSFLTGRMLIPCRRRRTGRIRRQRCGLLRNRGYALPHGGFCLGSK